MAHVSIYLNFKGNAEEAFNTYKRIFKNDFSAPMARMKDIPAQPDAPQIPEQDLNKVLHVALPIIGGVEIMGTDVPESMGHQFIEGNNVTISLNLDSKADADYYYSMLAEGGSDCHAPAHTFWGYWGVCKDRFGIRWMFNVYKHNL